MDWLDLLAVQGTLKSLLNTTVQFFGAQLSQAVPGCNLKNDRMISFRFQGKSLNITVIHVYATTTNVEEAEVEWFYQDLLELITQKRCPFHHRRLECKSRKSRDTWSNRQVWPWSTK